jgi:hypothetical protein
MCRRKAAMIETQPQEDPAQRVKRCYAPICPRAAGRRRGAKSLFWSPRLRRRVAIAAVPARDDTDFNMPAPVSKCVPGGFTSR